MACVWGLRQIVSTQWNFTDATLYLVKGRVREVGEGAREGEWRDVSRKGSMAAVAADQAALHGILSGA